MRLSLEVVYMRRCLIHPEGGVAADLGVRIPLVGLKGTVPELLFEKNGLIPEIQRLFVS